MPNGHKQSRLRMFGVSPSMVVAVVALTAAISGVAVAAPGVKVQHKVRAVAASSKRGPRGYRGYRGPRGYTGATGPSGVVPAIVTVDSPKETLNPGDNTFTVDPNGFQATCPSGYTVLGTGFDAAGVGQVGFVIAYGTFVGGFISNPSSIQIQVHLQATCGVVPGGSSGAYAVHGPSSAAQYGAMLKAASTASSAAR
jgi:hypothetical protein